MPWGYTGFKGKIFKPKKETTMRKKLIKFISVIAVCGAMSACGTESKEAAKDAASSVAKFAITAVKEAGSGTAEVVGDVAKETAGEATEAIKETAVGIKERAVGTAKQVADSVRTKVKGAR